MGLGAHLAWGEVVQKDREMEQRTRERGEKERMREERRNRQ